MGGIYNSAYSLVVDGSKIFGNTANGKADDIVNEYFKCLALMDDHAALVDLYAPDGLIPNKWAVDTYMENPSDPSGYPNTVFTMTFITEEVPDPTSTPEPNPTPIPEPTPEPTPTPNPEPVNPAPMPGPTFSPVEEEQPNTPVILTNGKAVLKAPEALYWTGYKDSRGGGAEGITRADLAFLMASMMDHESRDEWAVGTAPFDDVAPDAWYTAAIGTIENAGIMVGCGDGIFAPESRLTWGELILVFSRFTKEGEAPPEVYTGQHWAKDAINTAISLGWVEYSEAFDPGRAVTCGEMVDFIQTVFQWAIE